MCKWVTNGMNYIILNGIKSNHINGLLIQSLPPITKPQIRTQIEEIDGRDGDIVTQLGYTAFDKSFDIGLCGDYDVDEVIAYFNSKGQVTFSNEENKYYNYEIVKEIDFQHLLRFKTATVTMHVQPYKFSLIEKTKTFTLSRNLLNFVDCNQTANGITCKVTDGNISVTGTGTTATEFYIPINTVELQSGNYSLNAYSSGIAPSACSIRLINETPSSENSFGGQAVTLQNNRTVNITANLDEPKAYNYLYFYITSGVTMNFTIDLSLTNIDTASILIRNNGNTTAKPTVIVHGTGTINLGLNGVQVFVIELGTNESITIDTNEMNAYQDGILKNRVITGNYDSFNLLPGLNTLTFTGDVTQVNIYNYSRWI